jgi:hypothetical protein
MKVPFAPRKSSAATRHPVAMARRSYLQTAHRLLTCCENVRPDDDTGPDMGRLAWLMRH